MRTVQSSPHLTLRLLSQIAGGDPTAGMSKEEKAEAEQMKEEIDCLQAELAKHMTDSLDRAKDWTKNMDTSEVDLLALGAPNR